MGWKILCFFLTFLMYASLSETLLTYEQHKVCAGTSKRFTSQPDSYKNLKLFYDRNCTFIDGNLEITFLDQKDNYNLDFLSSIQVVTGYVLIAFNKVRSIPLHRLSVIRGMELLDILDKKANKTRGYSLYVTMNYDKNDERIGLQELQLRSLHDILDGDIRFDENKVLCYENDIIWEDIKNKDSKVFFGEASTQCPSCHPSCNEHCWGAGPEMCQILTKIVCSETCDHRCYGRTPDKCCHKECAGGCTGGRAQDCFACMNFNNDGTCVEYCPRRTKYNKKTFVPEEDPNGKYSYASLCVKTCPQNFLAFESQESCVPKCPQGYFADSETKTCLPCDGACPQTCQGNVERDLKDKYVNSINIHRFKGCTTIDGHLKFLDSAFSRDEHYNMTALTLTDLENLKDVREVTGYISVKAKKLRTLSFLRNLEYIRGRQKSTSNAALEVVGSGLTSLGLRSLRQVYGQIVIYQNPNLCYVEQGKLDLSLIGKQPLEFYSNQNKPHSQCVSEGHRCDEECASSSCWGPGPRNCLKCKRKRLDDICVSWCDPDMGIYDGLDDTCHHCDEQCLHKCVGPGPTNCTACKNVKDGPFCRPECPSIKYLEPVNKTCEPCHQLCDSGCTGSGSHVGPGGCNSCAMAVLNKTAGGVYQCRNVSHGCPYAYYRKLITFAEEGKIEKNLTNKEVCYQCHPQCVTCHGDGASSCHACTHVKSGRTCRDHCLTGNYADHNRVCRPCHKQCRKGCYGGLPSNCVACNNFRINSPSNASMFNCSEKCPETHQYNYPHEDSGDDVCSIEDPEGRARKQMIIAVSCSVGALVLILVPAFIIGYMLRQRARSKERTAQLQAKMQGIDDSEEPMNPSDAKPDLSKLRLIKESELRQGSIIGSGAFGTVYKGVWIPEDEKVKIPVAIKVLQEGTSPNQNQELLEEARVMASVEHMYCVRILAVCMTAQMMLVTQLMPLGCLLDYVRKHRENIGSKTLLNWCTQIAKGMAYLEGRGIVHRDLAARNVLVQNSSMVKITDFGLAKLLDFEESEYHAAGGKMPIKWLALECIQHRLFTHKTDVWSFGVTLWELFTYGQKPYESVRARDVPELLEKGERLVQPTICTIDVYMIMIKCWMLDADSRPSFAELADEFAKMSRDPGRYLVIQGDRLMRLPSQSYDAHDIMRSLSVATDGPEDVVTGDEYLMPSEYNGGESSPTSPYPPSPTSPFDPNRYGGGSMSKKPLLGEDAANGAHSQYYPKRDKKYGALEAAAAAKNENRLGRDRVDSLHSRYCSDPLGRHLLSSVKEGEEVPDEAMPLVEDTFNMPHAPPVPLPVDEDDYLQPQSQCPQYIDIDDSEKIEMEDLKSRGKQKPDYENIHDKPRQTEITMAMNNPEYFDCVPSNPSNNAKLQANGKSNKNHDYINEFDTVFHHKDNSAVC